MTPKPTPSKKIYLVGGAVRDMIMGLPVKDRDYVAVGFTPEEFSHLQQVGKDFPVFLMDDGSELALARVERKVGFGYGGFSVDTIGVTLEDDLKRRDLTINSIAYDEEDGTFIDPNNGIRDIDKKTLRHTSSAFVEDPLRVLRLARFRAKLGNTWKIHHSTKVLVQKMRNELHHLQKDRVWREIEKVLELKSSHIFFETLFELGVLDTIFPSIYALTTLKEGSPYHREDSCFVHTMSVLKLLEESTPLLKLTAIYHDIAKPMCYKEYGNSQKHEKRSLVEPLIDMQIPIKLKNRMLFLIENHIKIALLNKMKKTKIASFFESFKRDRELLEALLTFYDADNRGRICECEKEDLDREKILKIFDSITAYSPREWIAMQEKTPSGEAIATHIHAVNVKIIEELSTKGA